MSEACVSRYQRRDKTARQATAKRRNRVLLREMREKGLEPLPLAGLDPKSPFPFHRGNGAVGSVLGSKTLPGVTDYCSDAVGYVGSAEHSGWPCCFRSQVPCRGT